LLHHAPAAPTDQPEKTDEQRDSDEVEPQAQPAGKVPVQGIDADVGAVQKSRPQRPGCADGQGVAGEFVRAADRRLEKFAQQHVDPDQHGSQEHQCAAEQQAESGQAARQGHHRFKHPPFEKLTAAVII
jgi:hypothetical protein